MNYSKDKLYLKRLKGLQACKNYIATIAGFDNETDMWRAYVQTAYDKYHEKILEAIELFAKNKAVECMEANNIPEHKIVETLRTIKFNCPLQ